MRPLRMDGLRGPAVLDRAAIIAVDAVSSLLQVQRAVAMLVRLRLDWSFAMDRVFWWDDLAGKHPEMPNRLLDAVLNGNRRSEAALWGEGAPWILHPLGQSWREALARGDYWGQPLAPIIRRVHDSVLVCEYDIGVTGDAGRVETR